MKKIGIIGYGVMGASIYKRLREHMSDNMIMMCDTESSKLSGIANSTTDPKECVRESDLIILAVKPQSFAGLAAVIAPVNHKIIISIMAGITNETLKKTLAANKIVRTMPNLALSVGHSVTGWYSTELDEQEKKEVVDIIQLWGVDIAVEDEHLLDAITILSGSGPAYFYYLVSLLEQKGVEVGLSQEQAAKVTTETLIGAAHHLQESGLSAEELIQNVSSKGGTTEVVIQSLKDSGIDTIFESALNAGIARAVELNK